MQPSAEEYKRRYLENIEKLVLYQAKLVTFSAIITAQKLHEKSENFKSDGDDKNQTEKVNENSSFPFSFLNGKIKFDLQSAKNLPCDSDLRISRNLWSGEEIFFKS